MDTSLIYETYPDRFDITQPYFVGQKALEPLVTAPPKTDWQWEEETAVLQKRSPLHKIHTQLGAKMGKFAGWEMPLWYDSVLVEHQAVRQTAGLFDVSHMGVFAIEGGNATLFLDVVFTNHVAWLENGQSCYGFLLAPDGLVIDDAIVYRHHAQSYFMVVNAINEERVWHWLNQVNQQKIIIDRKRPWVQITASAILRNLKDPISGDSQKIDMALQGPVC